MDLLVICVQFSLAWCHIWIKYPVLHDVNAVEKGLHIQGGWYVLNMFGVLLTLLTWNLCSKRCRRPTEDISTITNTLMRGSRGQAACWNSSQRRKGIVSAKWGWAFYNRRWTTGVKEQRTVFMEPMFSRLCWAAKSQSISTTSVEHWESISLMRNIEKILKEKNAHGWN